ncbi:hypothetical protein STENM223S_03516 [Streptomyces tendae]
MGAGWVAGVTRARALRTRCLGAEGIREVAASPTLDDALRSLSASPYRHDVTPGVTPAEAQRAVSAALLWHLRILAGWQPAAGADAVRALAAGFEISNTEHRLRALAAGPRRPGTGGLHPPPYRLGALATAWTRLARTRTPSELRAVLTASVWGDPGGDSAAAVATGMRVSAAVRLATAVPDGERWAAARLALLVGREVFVVGRRMPDVPARRAARLLGSRAVGAGSYTDFRQDGRRRRRAPGGRHRGAGSGARRRIRARRDHGGQDSGSGSAALIGAAIAVAGATVGCGHRASPTPVRRPSRHSANGPELFGPGHGHRRPGRRHRHLRSGRQP